MLQANTLNLKLNLKKQPYSQRLTALRLSATFADSFNPAALVAERDLPYPITQAQLQLACRQLQQQFRARSVRLLVQSACNKYIRA